MTDQSTTALIRTASETAAAWGITTSGVLKLIKRGRVIGAELVIINGRATWIIPVQPKPEQLKPGIKPGTRLKRRKRLK